MSDKSMNPEVIVANGLATISLNPDGKVSVTMDKATFVGALSDKFVEAQLVACNPILAKERTPLTCLRVCAPVTINPPLPEPCKPIYSCPVHGCMGLGIIPGLPEDIPRFYEKGILTDRDLTAEQLQIIKAIRS